MFACVYVHLLYIVLKHSVSGHQVDTQESSRAQKKAEILENLKRLYPGVV